MSVPALLVGAAAVGAVWWGSRKPAPSASGGTQPGAGNTTANQGETFTPPPMPSISEPPVGVITQGEASTGVDVGVRTYQTAASPWDPSKVQTVTAGLTGGLADPSSSGSPEGPANGGLSTGSLPVNDVIAAGQSQPQTFQVGAISLVDTVMGDSRGTTRTDRGRTFATWGSRFGAIW